MIPIRQHDCTLQCRTRLLTAPAHPSAMSYASSGLGMVTTT
jgi:hypothetical protein